MGLLVFVDYRLKANVQLPDLRANFFFFSRKVVTKKLGHFLNNEVSA